MRGGVREDAGPQRGKRSGEDGEKGLVLTCRHIAFCCLVADRQSGDGGGVETFITELGEGRKRQ